MTALAGPVSNLILVIIFAGLYHMLSAYFPPTNLLIIFIQLSFILNVGLMIFNLIPVPPLDGSHLLLHAIPDKYAQLKMKIAMNGPMILLGLVVLNIVGISIFGWIYTVVRIFGAWFNVPVL